LRTSTVEDLSPGEPNRRFVSGSTYVRSAQGLATSPRCWTWDLAGPWVGLFSAGRPMASSGRPGQPFSLEPAWLVRSSRGAQYHSKALRQLLATLGVRGRLTGWPPARTTLLARRASRRCTRELVANQRVGGLEQGEAGHRRFDLSTPTPYGCTRRLAICPGRLRALRRSGLTGSP